MSQQRLPTLQQQKQTIGAAPSNFQIALIMNSHKKHISQLRQKKSNTKFEANNTSYRDLYQQNPKKYYLLQTKYTEIQRQNRLLFQKISSLNKNKQKTRTRNHSSFSQNHMGTLNTTFRKQQIEQIQRQNVKMFGRIQMQKPSISFRQTDKDYHKNKKMMERLSNLSRNKLHDWYA